MGTVRLSEDTAKSIRKRLKSELRFYKDLDKKFRRRYKLSLSQLEMKIEREGVPVEKHRIWEDSIEWRNATEEIAKAKKILQELRS
jgi:hypothetical protein